MLNKEILKICQKCGAKCCKLGGADVTLLERKRIINAKHPDYFLKINKNHYEMDSKNGICPYLKKNNSCSIYGVRPLPCLCFPVHPEFKNNKKKYFLALCPLGIILSKNIIKQLKKDSTKIKDHIIKNRFSDTNLSKSEINIIIKRFNKLKNIELH